ncbi:PKD domain-containing protein [Patescibacteria group bacterium]|nr:PKD domain-containing protein [Patescibacteria group bacterium]MBU1758147.1 PKD domain-containing protein [Patescibacteria group bacterium]
MASVGDRVNLSLEVNGTPARIEWEFGDGKTLECEGRTCAQTTTMYSQPGNYIIRAKVSYDDKPEVEGNITLRVQ